MTTTAGTNALPASDSEWNKLAQAVLDRRSRSYVQDALVLAHFVVNATTPERDFVQLLDNFNATSLRCSQLLEQRRLLARLIEKFASADPESRDEVVAEALVAARGAQ